MRIIRIVCPRWVAILEVSPVHGNVAGIVKKLKKQGFSPIVSEENGEVVIKVP